MGKVRGWTWKGDARSHVHRLRALGRIRAGLIGVAMTWTAGCASAAAQRLTDGSRLAGDVVLQVTNRASSDMQLYLVRGGMAMRLGIVPGFSSRTLGITSAKLGNGSELYLEARTNAEPEARRSPGFAVVPGQRIVWVIRAPRSIDPVVIR